LSKLKQWMDQVYLKDRKQQGGRNGQRDFKDLPTKGRSEEKQNSRESENS
jgi:hypothetical protein